MINNLTPQEHWELHQGVWNAIGCNMKVIEQDETTIRYIAVSYTHLTLPTKRIV